MYPMINREMYNQYKKTAMAIVTHEFYGKGTDARSNRMQDSAT